MNHNVITFLLIGTVCVVFSGCNEVNSPDRNSGPWNPIHDLHNNNGEDKDNGDPWGKLAWEVYYEIGCDPNAPAGTLAWLRSGNLDAMPEDLKLYLLGKAREAMARSVPDRMMFTEVRTSWTAVKELFRPCDGGGEGGDSPPDGGGEPGGPPSG